MNSCSAGCNVFFRVMPIRCSHASWHWNILPRCLTLSARKRPGVICSGVHPRNRCAPSRYGCSDSFTNSCCVQNRFLIRLLLFNFILLANTEAFTRYSQDRVGIDRNDNNTYISKNRITAVNHTGKTGHSKMPIKRRCSDIIST